MGRGVQPRPGAGPTLADALVLILDTQALVWSVADDGKLGDTARRAIDDAWSHSAAAVSAITFWEIAMLQAKGRLDFVTDFGTLRASLFQDGLHEIPVDGAIGIKAAQLPDFHGDPADRIIVATALDDHQLVTSDRTILDWNGNLGCLDARQ